MKRISNNFLFLLLLICGETIGQIISFDLRTGVVDNPNPLITPVLITPGQFDDTWTVNTPTDVPGQFHQVRVGSGPMPTNPINQLYNTYYWSSLGWISPYLDNSGAPLQNIPAGTCYYKMTFNLSTCPITDSRVIFRPMIVNDTVQFLSLNGSSQWLLTKQGSGAIFYTLIGANVIPGQNEVIIGVSNEAGWAGLQMHLYIQVETCASAQLNLKDKDGNPELQFCIDEGAFINTMGSIPGKYKLELMQEASPGDTAFNQVAITGLNFGSPNGVDLKHLFETQFGQVFQVGVNYKLRVHLIGPCGPFVASTDFSFKCCGDSPDPSFTLVKSGTQLTGQSSTSGTHFWQIYSASPYNGDILGGGSGITETPTFSHNSEGNCFLVTHTVINVCGRSCNSQRYCSFVCEEKECNVKKPENLTYNTISKSIEWDAVTNATGYEINILKNGCCAAGGGSGSLSNAPIGVPDNTPYPIDLFGAPEEVPAECYLITVHAKCPDGSISVAATYCLYP